MQSLRLPGWRSTLRITPLRHPIDVQQSIKLHGALHTVAGIGHDTERSACQRPLIVLIPRDPISPRFESESWEAHWMHPEAHRLSDTKKPMEIFGAVRRVEIGPMHEVTQQLPPVGSYKVTVRSVTPLLIKSAGQLVARMNRGVYVGTVHQSVRRWFGKTDWMDAAALNFERFAEQPLTTDTRWSGGAIAGHMVTWQGRVNEAGLLALRVCEQLGMGSTVSRGFGRIHVAVE